MLVCGVSAGFHLQACHPPLRANHVCPLLSPMPRGSCSAHVPAPAVSGGFSPYAFVSPQSRTISGLGGSVNSLLFGGTVPLLDASCSIKNNNMVVGGFFRS